MRKKRVHKLTNINVAERTATCSKCGPVRIKIRKEGDKSCMNLIREQSFKVLPLPLGGSFKNRYNGRQYRILVKPSCERCGFIPVSIRQMDVHHKDGDHSNNSPENLETLCANCHRLVHA